MTAKTPTGENLADVSIPAFNLTQAREQVRARQSPKRPITAGDTIRLSDSQTGWEAVEGEVSWVSTEDVYGYGTCLRIDGEAYLLTDFSTVTILSRTVNDDIDSLVAMVDSLIQQRDELAAVVDQVEILTRGPWPFHKQVADKVDAIRDLFKKPRAKILALRDGARWAEGRESVYEDIDGRDWGIDRRPNPYAPELDADRA